MPKYNETPPPTVNIVQVSDAQVWSAAVQNVAIAAILGYLIVIGKCSTELGIPGLLLIGGIDLFSRLKSKASGAAALAIGSTGIIGHLPHIVVALAMGSAMVGGCQ